MCSAQTSVWPALGATSRQRNATNPRSFKVSRIRCIKAIASPSSLAWPASDVVIVTGGPPVAQPNSVAQIGRSGSPSASS